MKAFLFPGQGAQTSTTNSSLIQEVQNILGFNPFDADKINLTAYAQPAILAYSIDCLRQLDQKPAYLAGHSVGEYSALVAAGVLSFEEALKAVHHRGLLMQEAVPLGQGGMLAVLNADISLLERYCQELTKQGFYVSIANYNSPTQTVLSGTGAGLQAIQQRLLASGIRKSIPLSVSAPFHCELMKPAQNQLAQYLEKLHFKDSAIPIISNVHAKPIVSGKKLRELLIKQVTAPVQWTRVIRFLQKAGVTELIEVGPGCTLSKLLQRTPKRVKKGV